MAVHEISCTFVVAILDDFRPRAAAILPGAPPGPFQRTVISNWFDVYEAAHSLLLDCFTAIPYFGYVTLRKWYPDPVYSAYLVAFEITVMANIAESRRGIGRQNLGVFFWATDSVMNGYLPPYTELEANPSTVETE